MSFRSNVGGRLHDLQLFRALNHAHLVNDRRRIDNRLRWMNRLAIQRTHAADLFNDPVVEISIDAQPVIEHVSAIEKLGQLPVKLLDRKSLIRPKLTLRAFNTGATTVPNLSFWISWSHKQRVLRLLLRSNNRDRIRFFEAGQVKEIGILPKTIMSVVGASGSWRRENGHRFRCHASHKLLELGLIIRTSPRSGFVVRFIL